MTPTATITDTGAIAVRTVKCVLILWPAELVALIVADPQVWKKAVTRGKFHKRSESTARRCGHSVNDSNGNPRPTAGEETT